MVQGASGRRQLRPGVQAAVHAGDRDQLAQQELLLHSQNGAGFSTSCHAGTEQLGAATGGRRSWRRRRLNPRHAGSTELSPRDGRAAGGSSPYTGEEQQILHGPGRFFVMNEILQLFFLNLPDIKNFKTG